MILAGKHKQENGKAKKPETKLAEAEEMLKKIQAEYENYIKRVEKMQLENKKIVVCETVQKMLPVLDSIEAAVENAKKAKSISRDEAITGLKTLREQVLSAMKGQGLEQMNCVGEKFDAGKHEVMLAGNENGKEEGIVLEEFQKGYSINGQILRHAKVKVNKRENK